MMHTLQHLPLYLRGKGRGKRKELSKDRKGMLIYTMVKVAVFCGRNPMNKTLERNPSTISTATQECQPSNAFHTAGTETS
jgi:hypothetical protein